MRKIYYGILAIVLFIFGYYIATGGGDARTAYLEQLEHIDPLFYSPGIDTEALSRAVQRTKLVEQEILAILSEKEIYTYSTNDKQFLIDHGFLPIEFLEAFTYVLQARESFIERPSMRRGLLLLSAQRNAARAYTHDATQFHTLATRDAAKQSQVIFAGLASRINPTVLGHDARLITENGTTLTTEVNMRFTCFLFMHCTPTQETPGRNIETLDPITHDSTLLPREALAYVSSDESLHGPFNVESSCFEKRIVPLFLISDEKHPFLPKRADENFYFSLEQLDPALHSPSQEAYYAAGKAYRAEPEGSNYRCTDLTYWGTLATHAYHMNHNDLSEQERQLLVQNQLPYFDRMLDAIAGWLEVYRDLIAMNDTGPSSVLSFRSAYSLTYGTFSDSIWRIDQQPLFVSEQNLQPMDVYATYSELRAHYSPEEILQFHSAIK